MAKVIITLKIMPETPEVNLEEIKEQTLQKITEHIGEGEIKTEIKPVAFGLNSLNIIFVMDENKGSTDSLEENIANLEGVQSVECTDVRRALG